MSLPLEPLTPEAFQPFGQVLDRGRHGALVINQGFARRWNDLAKVDVTSEGGQPQICLFDADPRPSPVRIEMMERHPLGTQMFFPLQDRPWLVVVCSQPTMARTYRAFLASGQQGVSYGRNVWHHPLLVFDRGSRFIVVDRAGPGQNLEEKWLTTEQRLELAPHGAHQ